MPQIVAFADSSAATAVGLVIAGLVAVQIYALIKLRSLLRRDKRPAPATLAPAADNPAPLRLDLSEQTSRLFAIAEHATASARVAIDSHAGAASHLDSAEYQLLRLFDEFPSLCVLRAPSVTTLLPAPTAKPAPRPALAA